jgi:hypothetical protein
MTDNKGSRKPEEMRCATCGIRRLAEANPEKIFARVWKWHTGWCPGWNNYQRAIKAAGEEALQATTGV